MFPHKLSPDTRVSRWVKQTTMSAYLEFMKANRQRIKDENAGISFKDLNVALASAWRALSDDAKLPFKKAAAETRVRNPDYGKRKPKKEPKVPKIAQGKKVKKQKVHAKPYAVPEEDDA